MKTIETNKAPSAIGPYSQAKVVGGLLITSGQIPVNPETGEMPATIAEQTEQSCKNVQAIIEAAGGKMENVVKTTCFLSDIANFVPFNEVYAKYFTSKPARSCVAVREIPKGAMVEIEAIVEL